MKSSDTSLYEARGKILLSMNQLPDAVKDFDSALALDPQLLEVRELRGHALVRMQRYKDAIPDLTAVLQADPQNVNALSSRGKAYEALKLIDAATKDFTRVIEIDPQHAGADVDHELAKAKLLKGDYVGAIETFTKAIQRQPDYGLAYANRGVAYRNKGDFAHAADDFRKALTLLKEPERVRQVTGLLREAEAGVQASRRVAPPRTRSPEPPDFLPYFPGEKRLW